MTNHWNDFQHTDVFLAIGCNPAENHPIGMRWILKAKAKGAKLISVDPRYTRTSVQSDVYASLRSGTDIAFLGGMVSYILEKELYQKEYVMNYTNSSFLVNEQFSFDDGLFNAYDEEHRSYDQSKWGFQLDETGAVKKDPTLQDPRCVLQIMKKHFSRYDIDTVCKTTGTPKDHYLQVLETYCATGKENKAGSILYALGMTHHTVGSQNVRLMGIVQLLLGNVGIAGGGLNALRGESNVQGATDFGVLYDKTNGYMEVPLSSDATWQAFIDRITPKTGYFSNKPKFYTSQQKSFYGDNATPENQFGYEFLPKLTPKKDYSHMRIFETMAKKQMEGLFLWGENPVVAGPDSSREHGSLANLKWLVVVDPFETESAAFWKEEAGKKPADIQTEVFFLPAAVCYEKEGSLSNSGRWMQYRWKAIEPKGNAKADLEILHNLASRLKKAYASETTPAAKQLQALTWDYGTGEIPDIDKVCREINGFDLKTGKLLDGFGAMLADGTTSGGNWIYTGFYTEKDGNKSKRRDNKDVGDMGTFLNWSYAWPSNRRVLYNRASCDLNGKPYNPDRVLIKWDAAKNEWNGADIPDFLKAVSPEQADGAGKRPFIMSPSGVGNLFANMKDGPLPEHYEPWESPISNNFSSIQLDPAVVLPSEEYNLKGDVKDFPFVATSYGLTEHWKSGSMTRNQKWLSEIAPYMFIEISEELSKEKGIANGDTVIVSSARGEIECYALVTKRLKPFTINGGTVHQVGMPMNYGFKGYARGAIANTLTPHIGDVSTSNPEYKAFLCNVRRAK